MNMGCAIVIVGIIAVILWFFGVLGVVVNTLLYILLILLGFALVAGMVWLFLPYRGKVDDKNRNHKKLEDKS